MNTFDTKYGKVSLLYNELYIGNVFKSGQYWDEDTLLKLKEYIHPNRNLLEIGGHCGTSTLVYSSFLNNDKKVFVYEPQKIMFNTLVTNIQQNGLEDKIIAYNSGVFCYNGVGKMNETDIDGGGGKVEKRYNEENSLPCNFGGIGLGQEGEEIQLTMIDSMGLKDIGFIHCDAQGSENFIFSKGVELITKNRPVIYFEDNEKHDKKFFDIVCSSYPEYKKESEFNVKKFCMENLYYSACIENFNGGIDTLLIP